MEKIYFSKKFPEEMIEDSNGEIFYFFNLHNIWWLSHSKDYSRKVLKNNHKIFPDGEILALKLGVKQQRGSSFVRRFLLSDPLSKNKKHFFIGLEKKDALRLSKITKIPLKNISSYNPPYIKEIEFIPSEREKIEKLIKKSKPDYIWVGIGSPKQDILANQLFEKYPCFYFNVGAGMDFLLRKKKESPKIFSSLGIEWLYRLLTDFKTTKKKAWRSFIALMYLNRIRVK